MGIWGPREGRFLARSISAFSIVAAFGFVGCLPNSGVSSRSIFTASIKENCEVPDQAAIRNIDRRLSAAGILVGPDFCSTAENYSCYRRVFSPTVADGKSIESECAKVSDLGGEVCLKLESHSFSTFEAARRADTPAESLRTGGEFNRSEYVCHQKELKDGDLFLAIGEGESLSSALAASYAQCAKVAPRLGSVGEAKK